MKNLDFWVLGEIILRLGLWQKHCPKNENSADIGQNYSSRNKKPYYKQDLSTQINQS